MMSHASVRDDTVGKRCGREQRKVSDERSSPTREREEPHFVILKVRRLQEDMYPVAKNPFGGLKGGVVFALKDFARFGRFF